MNTLPVKAVVVAAALSMASPAMAKTLKFTVNMKSYGGPRAYVAVYLVDSRGRYVSTLYAAGSRAKYQKHLSRWFRMLKRSRRGVDGVTGASAGSGASFAASINLPDKVFKGGYTVRVESAVENRAYYADDVAIELKSSNNGSSARGSGFVKSISIQY